MAGSFDLALAFTETIHRETYPTISPQRHELSQEGKTVLITGSTEGIGLAIAKSFIEASAARAIIISRRAWLVDSTVIDLSKLAADQGKQTQIIGRVGDTTDPTAIEKLWAGFKSDGIVVDVLVLNTATMGDRQKVLEQGIERIWETFKVNARAPLDHVERFWKQEEKGADGRKYVVHISTGAIHEWKIVMECPGYAMTKNAGTLAIQHVAAEIPVAEMQIVSVQPGLIFTESAKNFGWTEDTRQWDSPKLPGDFAVWAASPEAEFLHGRFVWAAWDVDELRTGVIRKRIEEDWYFLKVGVRGL